MCLPRFKSDKICRLTTICGRQRGEDFKGQVLLKMERQSFRFPKRQWLISKWALCSLSIKPLKSIITAKLSVNVERTEGIHKFAPVTILFPFSTLQGCNEILMTEHCTLITRWRNREVSKRAVYRKWTYWLCTQGQGNLITIDVLYEASFEGTKRKYEQGGWPIGPNVRPGLLKVENSKRQISLR